jgi:hypothetical protein
MTETAYWAVALAPWRVGGLCPRFLSRSAEVRLQSLVFHLPEEATQLEACRYGAQTAIEHVISRPQDDRLLLA